MAQPQDKITKIIDTVNPSIEASVTQRGSKGALAVDMVDSSGNSIGGSASTGYETNDVDEPTSTLTYVGKESADGSWLIQKIDASSNPTTIQYATIVNNSGTVDYSTAFTNRASLIYGDYSIVF